jgi:hypothetical protein
MVIVGPLKPNSYSPSEKRILMDQSWSGASDKVPVIRKMIMDKRFIEAFHLANDCRWTDTIRQCLKSRLSGSVEQEAILEAAKILIRDNQVHVAYGLLKVLATSSAFDAITPQLKEMCDDAFVNMSIAGEVPAAA